MLFYVQNELSRLKIWARSAPPFAVRWSFIAKNTKINIHQNFSAAKMVCIDNSIKSEIRAGWRPLAALSFMAETSKIWRDIADIFHIHFETLWPEYNRYFRWISRSTDYEICLKQSSADISVEKQHTVTTTQAAFLANKKKKKILLQNYVPTHLSEMNIPTVQAEADADVTIIDFAINNKQTGTIVIVFGEDTDLLVLLIARAKNDANIWYFRPRSTDYNHKWTSTDRRHVQLFIVRIRIHRVRYNVSDIPKR